MGEDEEEVSAHHRGTLISLLSSFFLWRVCRGIILRVAGRIDVVATTRIVTAAITICHVTFLRRIY